MLLLPISFFALSNLLFIVPISAQTTADGDQLTLTHTIEVTKGHVGTRIAKFEGHTITVFEADADATLDLWKAEYERIATDIGGSKPVKAKGVRLPELSAVILTVLAEAKSDKKARRTHLTLAFLINDSTTLEENGKQENVMHALSVKLNKAVVQGQIDEHQAMLNKTSEQLSGSQEDKMRSQEKLREAHGDMEEHSKKQTALQHDIADLHGDISGYERKFALSNDPKDLQRLTKARN